MKTQDRAILVNETIGQTQHLTNEGYLLCEGVKVARTGSMMYHAYEMPDIDAGSASMIVMTRDADALFHLDTLASLAGKPATVDHPEEFVDPINWKTLTVGIAYNPRRGEGSDSEYLIADLLITDAKAIQEVRGGLREVSLGYDSEREQIRPGVGKMTKIVINHVALVEKGRCGPTCAIQDKETVMTKITKRTVFDRLKTAFQAKDEAAFNEEMQAAQEEMSGGGSDPQKILIEVKAVQPDAPSEAAMPEKDEGDYVDNVTTAIAALSSRFDDMDARLSKLEGGAADALPDDDKKDGEDKPESKDELPDDEDKKSMDSVKLRDEFADVLYRAEILAPGFKAKTFDAKADRKLTLDTMCKTRRQVLTKAVSDKEMATHIHAVIGLNSNTFDKLRCSEITMIFNGASELARKANNTRVTDTLSDPTYSPMTPVKYQAMIDANRKKS